MTHTFKSDHGKFASAEDGGGTPGHYIDGRPSGLMTASRDAAGAWEEFTIEATDEWEYVGLKSRHGKFACCEDEGKAGIVVFNRDSPGAWEKFKIHFVDGGKKLAFESKCRPGYFIKAHENGRVTLEQSMYENKPSDKPGGFETFTCDPPVKTAASHPMNVITGQLRISGSGYADDKGPYLPIGIHMGDLFSCFCHGQHEKVQDALSKIRDAGYGLVQFWLNLGSLGGSYWAGREIGPEITPGFWEKLRQFSDLLDSYGLKGIYCTGDYALRGMSHKDFARELGNVLVHRDTAGLVIAGNEAWQTGADSIATLLDFCDAFKAVCPDVPITTTAPPTEAKEDIANWCGGDYYAIHGYRGAEDHDRIRHIFSVPWEGDPPTKYGYQDEPTGPGDEVSVKASHCYEGRDVDAHHLVALAVQSLNNNQGFNFFCGDGVKLTGDISRWPGFKEVASVTGWVPKDIMSWPKAIHFGTTQADRIFEPTAEDTLRFDHRIGHDGRFFGMFYGDEGTLRARCKRACFLKFIEFDGAVGSQLQFDSGQEINLQFVRSQGGKPGYTAQFVVGRLR